MYTDIADEILDDMLDKVYSTGKKIYENKKLSTVIITKYVEDFLASYENNHFKNYNDGDLVFNIKQIYKNYIAYYVLVYAGCNLKDNEYTKFILSFDRDSIFNSRILEVNETLNKIMFISKNKDKIQDKSIVLDMTYHKALNIYNTLSEIFTSNLSSKDIFHSVVKYVLFATLFVIEDKATVYQYLEEYKLQNLKTKYIEIIESIGQQINYDTLEKLLNEYDQVFISEMYDMILTDDEDDIMMLEDKIKLLFQRHLVIPITDDFLRYNKSSEIYDQSTNIDANVRSNKKNNTKIKYIINKINEVIDFYKNKNTKHFYSPLYYRKAVLVNDMEEIDILKKLDNTQNKTDEQISHYEELTLMRKYPYQNFRDFKSYGYELDVNHGSEAIRLSNIEFNNDPKYEFIKNNKLDWRILTSDVHNNIVGLALGHDVTDVGYLDSNIGKLVPFNSNSGINGLIKQIKNQILTDSHNKNINYWLFNKEKDQIKKFNEISNFPQNEYFKFLTAYIYDVISETTYEKIINVLSSSEPSTFEDAIIIVRDIERQFLPLTKNRKNDLYIYIFTKYLKQYKKEYDAMEDYIPGKTKTLMPLIKAPEFANTGYKKVIELEEDICTNLLDIYDNAQCQHIVTWNKIKTLRTSAPNKFNDRLHSFFKEFVVENLDREFICKSCSETIDAKRYIADWTSSTEEGITMTLMLHTSLENMSEYERYNVAIANMEKILERIASSSGLLYYTGAKITAKQRRQESIKMVIDLITAQYEKMKKMDVNDRKKRMNQSALRYGISPNITQFFLFELKNDIFTYSSKEVDKFKKGKVNNIVAYILLITLIEMTSSVVHGFTTEKMLNYYVFEKVGYSLFDGLYIRINTGNDISPIKHYKLLCYCIYMISGYIIKYNMWFSDSESKKSLINAMDQKIIIHTAIDLLNNILDFNNPDSTNYIYEYYAKKFFSVLQSVFIGEKATSDLDQLKNSIEKRIQVVSSNKIIFKTSKERESVITNYYEKPDFGPYHWPSFNQGFQVKQFKTTLTYKEVFTESEYNKLRSEVKYDNEKTKNNLKREKTKKVHDTVYHLDNVTNDLYEHIENTIVNWEKYIGANARIGNSNLYLRHNVYTIDHDKDGNKIDNVKKYTDNDGVIIFKKNDPHFNANVYYYYDKEKDVHMYYNSQTYNYIGYRSGKTYHNVTDTNANLKPIVSIKNKLLFLGHTNLYYPITKELEESISTKTAQLSNKLRKYISELTRTRIGNLKNTLMNIQRILNQTLSDDKKHKTEEIALKFHKKFKQLNLFDNGKRVFGDMNEVINTSFFKSFDKNISVTVDKDYLYVGNLIKIYNTDHKLVMYICNEINKLIEINDDEHTRVTLIYLFAHIIHQEYNNHNYREFSNTFADVKRFVNMESNNYVKIEIEETDIFAGMSEEEIAEAQEEMYDDQEMRDAIDVDFEDPEDGDEQVASTYCQHCG